MTDIELKIDVEAVTDEKSIHRFERLRLLHEKVTFETEVMLRAKTFYSTAPFPMLPGQTMLTLKGQLRLNDQGVKLNTVKSKPVRWSYLSEEAAPAYAAPNRELLVKPVGLNRISWESLSTTSATSPEPQIPRGKWTTKVHLPISAPSALLPTFCSAIVARQYSLLIRVNTSNISIKPFILETPIQVIYPPPEDTEGYFARRASASPRLDPGLDLTTPRYFESMFGTEEVSISCNRSLACFHRL